MRGSHDSNDRLEDAFDTLMTAYAKVRARDPKTGKMATYRLNLLGTNKEEDAKDGYFHYTFPPDLLAIISESTTWAAIKSNIMYALRSKYSIRLYEMIERRIGLTKQHEEFTVDTFAAMIGVPEGKLERFADFNKYCLKPALEEVNHLTDFHVEVSAIKKGRAVEKLFMTWLKKRPDEVHRAHEEREKSRVGRRARWGSKVERVVFNEHAVAAQNLTVDLSQPNRSFCPISHFQESRRHPGMEAGTAGRLSSSRPIPHLGDSASGCRPFPHPTPPLVSPLAARILTRLRPKAHPSRPFPVHRHR